jgi:hypothetical protein
MSNVITHPRFDRPRVVQPQPRRRQGTISFRGFREAVLTHPDFARARAPGWYARYRASDR